jgi:transposase InsO family protein
MEQEKVNYPVVMMARLLNIARQGFYAWVKHRDDQPKPSVVRRVSLADQIMKAWQKSKRRHGGRRIRADLAKRGVVVSLWLVRKIMTDLGIEGIQPRKPKKTTIPDPNAKDRPDLLRRCFYPPVPTTFLVGDITYLRTGEGWLYLATVIDLTTRMVVGWQMADHMRASLVVDALQMAHQAGLVAGNAVFHSDRGTQYTSTELALAATRMDVRLSVGRTGSAHDNAVAESFFAALKNEMYYQQVFKTRGRARLAVAEYIEIYYNRNRPHSTLDYRTPAESMADHFPPILDNQTALRLAA